MGTLDVVEKTVQRLNPEDYLVPSDVTSNTSLLLLKQLYDLTKSIEKEGGEGCPSFSGHSKSKRKNRRQQLSKTETPLMTLLTEGFDEDQIWEELQLQNSLLYDALVSSTSKVLAYKPDARRRKRPAKQEGEQGESEEDEDILNDLEQFAVASGRKVKKNVIEEEDDEDDDSDFFESDGKHKNKKNKTLQKYDKSIVDDKFFNLAQMTEFIDQMDKQAERGDEQTNSGDDSEDDDGEDIDYFKDDDNDPEEDEETSDSATNVYYKDYFDPPLDQQEARDGDDEDVDDDDVPQDKERDDNGRIPMQEDEDDDSDDNGDNNAFALKEEEPAVLSTFEKKRRRIEETIKEMEEESLKPKAWQLSGEVTAQTRPENSLLEEHLMHENLVRQAPEMTVKTTQKLEDIIKQRIRDLAWDDVIRKLKPIENVAEYKKRLVLDAEKSKTSLTELYEKEYLEKQGQLATVAAEEKESDDHKAIQKQMTTLFAKLDALSHFSYTPKAPTPEIKTIYNQSATAAEEITPSTFSDAMLLAPKEILAPSKGEIKTTAERTSTDRKRERRLKKKKQHLKRLAQEEKARSRGLGLQNIKLAENVVKKAKKGEESISSTKELKSSKAFFTKLQDQVTGHVKNIVSKQSAKSDSKLSAKKYKL